MANTNSNVYANIVAVPPVKNNVGEYTGKVRRIVGVAELAAADFDADGDTVKFGRVPSNARMMSILMHNDALDTGSTVAFNCGLYDTLGAIVGESTYASAVAAQAAAKNTELVNEARNIDETGNAVWEDAGLSADPGGMYDIVLTATAANAGAQAGTLVLDISYTVD